MNPRPDARRIPGPWGIALTDRDAVDEQIAYVLDHPFFSAWLKDTLREALDLDPVQVLNDLEVLNLILRQRSHLLIEERIYGRP